MLAKALFLHGGPGLHAGIERRWFGDTLPVHWWDQPRANEGDPAPFASLVSTARQELSRMFAAQGAPVPVVAHSFGALVARALAHEVPDLIESLSLLAPTQSVFCALRRLAARLPSEAIPRASGGLAEVPPEPTPSWERFVEFIQQLLAAEDLFDCYWGVESGSVRDRYKRIADELAPLDAETFLAVAYDSLRDPIGESTPNLRTPATIIVGRQDPLFAESDICLWQIEFPNAEVAWHDCGHWAHFELAPALWTPHQR